ncbi:protein kinase [Wenzhouxiangella sp. AB-CW3]|uniref:serine/threonine-protein kinase n=1 Tax=Wenzhouxiangella sp. AB-CW3 TaxID=2771012 RepID=UPI00168A45AB|nr:serine/threonine-protein kinase [Wenzhouxiangella sp. AB-CW3]QOC21152.1 protein kinase [Wenzhouxiangella sp. AB-CW3]
MERLGRYRITRELGRGSMSIVYEAFDPHIDRHLAIKVLRERYARDVKSRQRFLREARSAGGLSHPGIVTVFDVGQADGLPYMVMERLQGQSLDSYLEEVPALDARRVIEIGIQLAGALHYAHERGIVHRDVKPSNIFIDPESGLVKLVDFGIAAIDRRLREGQAGQDASIVGTPRYMPPEQLQGERPDQRSDLYSLGVVLYRALSGHLPFQGEPLAALIRQIVNDAPPRLSAHDPHTPVELVELVTRLLAKEPEARHADGALIREELQEIRSDLDRGLLKQARGAAPAWRWPLALSLCLALVLGAGLTWVWHSQRATMTETTLGFGDGLASVIARETAEALLLEDATALGNLVDDFAANDRITHLHIVDRHGQVQASTNPFLQGEEPPILSGTAVERDGGHVRLVMMDDGHLEFQAPIRFQGRRIGQAQLGVDGSQLQTTAWTTMWMLAIVFLATVLVSAIGFAWIARSQRRSIQRLAWGLQRIARGQYDFRLDDTRLDALSTLFRRFNDMAVRLDERHGHEKSRMPAPLLPSGEDTLEGEIDDTREMDAADRPVSLRSISGGKDDDSSTS